MIGKTISHYRILEKLGEGGMGVVYKAQDTKLKRTVALKFLPQELLCDSESKARFVHEAQAASALNHPNITTIYEIDEVNQKCFISMEYIDGNSLKELIYKRTLAIDEILAIALKIAEGLKAAHKKEIVHRDVKSDNVMVTDEGEVKIMDFGLAKLKGVTKLTKTGTTLGTMQYMSPEQARGIEVDQRSDIFSFGVVLYEMITGQLPFKGEHEAAVIYSIVNETPEPLARYKANVPEGLQRIVDKALQKDLSTRYQSAAETIADLKRLQKETTTGVGVKATLPKRPQRFKQLVWGIALLFVVGIAIAGVLVLKPLLVSKQAKAKSLAVLSFENLGTEADGYLASGLAEDLAIKLRKLAGFRVASSEDIRRLNKEELLPKQIASRLKVEYALGGSLLKAGEWIRVNVEVIEQASGEVIWSEQLHRKFTNIHEFHDEVSRKIAKVLKVGLSPAEQIALKERPTDSPEAYDHYLKGRHYYYNVTFRDNEFAEREFERALQLDPDYPLALAGLADAYVQRYKERFDYDEYWLDSAEVLIDKALALDSDLAEAYESRAEVLLEEDNIAGALEAAEKARDLRPDWDEPYVHLGNIYRERGERSKALAMFDTALSMRQSVDALCGKGNIFQTRGYMDSAAAAYRAAQELNPYHDRPYLELGWLHEELHEWKEAEKLFRRAIEVRPDRADGYEWLCSTLGSVQEGEELLRGFVERFPYNWNGYKALYDYLYDIKGQSSAAFEVVDEAVRRNPKRVWPHLFLASSYVYGMSPDAEPDEAMSASEKAVPAVNRALALRPNSGRVLERAGWVYVYLNRLDEAMDYFDRALEIRPASGDLPHSVAWALLSAKEYEKALVFAHLAVKHSPGNHSYYRALRSALVNLNRWQEFFDIIQEAAREYGDDPLFLRDLCREQRLAGQFEEAISTCQRASAVKRTGWWEAPQLGITLWLSGDTEGALDRLREEKGSHASAYWIVAILKSEGRFREIEQYLEGIKEESPDWADVASSYYVSMRQFDDALSVFAEFRQSGEETWSAYNTVTMARCYRKKGAVNSARHLLEDLLDRSTAGEQTRASLELARLEAIGGRDLTTPLELVKQVKSELAATPDDVTNVFLARLQYASGLADEVAKTLGQIRCYWTYAPLSGSPYRKAQLAAAIGSRSAKEYLDHAIPNLTRLTRGQSSYPHVGRASAFLALALARAKKRDEARQEVKRALKLEPERADIAYHAACAYSLIGDTTLALQWLETAVERGHQELWWARVDPDLDPLRELPRFQEIMNDWDTHLRKLFD